MKSKSEQCAESDALPPEEAERRAAETLRRMLATAKPTISQNRENQQALSQNANRANQRRP